MLQGKTPQTSDKIDYKTNLNDIDSMLAEFAKPKQEMPSAPQTQSNNEPPQPNNPVFDPTIDDYPVTEHENTPIDPEKNERQGLRIAKMVDGAISLGAMKLAYATTTQPYKATPGELDDIGEAWAEYTKDKDIDLPPWLSLAFLYVTVYMPRIIKAFNDKRLYEQDEKIENHDNKLADLTAKYDELLKNSTNGTN